MTPEQWKRLKEIFDGALAQPAEERRAWLRRQCGGDEDLLMEAEALLDSHESAEGFLDDPPRIDPADLDTLPDGTQLGAYRIVREIGRGGMGVVYLGEDNLGRAVAIKTLPPVLAANSRLRERLAREARAAANIRHTAVATVYVFAEIDGHLLIVSEYVPGETLRSHVSRGAIPSNRAYGIALQIARALAAAHDAGVVHRDLKPENILVTPDDNVKVVDFGIAHIEPREAPRVGTRLTVPGTVFGTPGYMPPEQRFGGIVTPRVDVYAFGVVFSEMLTGRQPLDRSSADVIPQPFADIVATCLNSDPDRRYASGRELLAALEQSAIKAAGVHPGRKPVGSPQWWWEFHQVITSLIYWLMTWPAWKARGIIGGPVGRTLFIATLLAVIVAANLRLHLWFTSRFYPAQLRWARRRTRRLIQTGDWLFVVSLAVAGILVGEDRSPVAVVLIAVAVGAAIAFLIIERATARAAFRNAANRQP